MNRPIFWLLLAAMLFAVAPAGAVKLAGNDDAQVLLFPFFSTETDSYTEVTVRNRSAEGKAVRVVVKEVTAGRPILSVNVYLKAGDAWTGRLIPRNATSARLVSTDESCTFPAITAAGVNTVRGFLNSSLPANRLPAGLLEAGYIEAYDMGTVDSELAGDCAAIAARWDDGVWSGLVGGVRNDDVGAPVGGLSGRVFANGLGMTFAFQATALAEFRDSPLHTHPLNAGRPALSDVRPAQVKVLVADDSAATPTLVERVSTFPDEPLYAVEAALMVDRLRGEYDSDVENRHFAGAMVLFPTQPYGALGAGYYVGADQRQPLGVGDGTVSAGLLDSAGIPQTDLVTPPAGQACDTYSGVLNFVSLIGFIAFSHVCDLADAEVFLANDAYEGEVSFNFSGELTSAEGHTFSGLPVIGHLFQTRLRDTETNIGAYALPMDRD